MPQPSFRALSCASLAAALFLAGCQSPAPKHKSPGKYDEWKSYEGRNLAPKAAVVKAVDPAAGTILLADKEGTVLHVTPQTRVLHDNADVPLSQLPVNTRIKYTFSSDGERVTTVWFGKEATTPPVHGTKAKKQATSFF